MKIHMMPKHFTPQLYRGRRLFEKWKIKHGWWLITSFALIAVVPLLWAGEAKEYPLALKVLKTDAISSKADGSQTTTTCSYNSASEQITCDSRQISGATHTELVSFAEASDGKTYTISCVPGSAARFAQGFAAGAGSATVTGCMVPPGTYKARWDEGRLKVLHDKNGKSKETTFVILNSVAAPTTSPAQQASPLDKTVLKVSSTPAGADIELDGSFVGQTPSSVLVLPGDHSVRINGGCWGVNAYLNKRFKDQLSAESHNGIDVRPLVSMNISCLERMMWVL